MNTSVMGKDIGRVAFKSRDVSQMQSVEIYTQDR